MPENPKRGIEAKRLPLIASDGELESTISPGPPPAPDGRAHYDLANGQHVRFFHWDDQAAALTQQFLDDKYAEALQYHYTDLWDDQWYYQTTEVNTFVLMMALNLDTHDFRHVAIVNTPDHWGVYGGSYIEEGHANRRKISVEMGGSGFDFDIWNPTNNGGFTPNHIIISWGI